MFPSPTKSCPFVLLLLFCLLLSFSFPGNSLLDAASQPSPPPSAASPSAGFWISVELLSVDFRKGCISTALCHQPAFKLTQLMTLNGQSAVMNWPVEGTGPKTLLQKDIPRQFIAHWPLGDPEDVSIGCQIAGTDPSFGFARTCDETAPRRLFQEQLVRRILPKGLRRNGIDPSEGGDGGEGGGENNDGDGGNSLLVQMNGRCFNATLAVQKHISRCPWCPDPNVDIQVVGGTAGTGQMAEQLTPKDDALQLQNALILALSGAVVFSLTGLCCALGAHWRYRKRNNLTGRRSKGTTAPLMLGAGRKKRILKLVSPPRAQRSLPSISPMDEQHQRHQEREATAILYGQRGGEFGATMGAEEQRYDVPWDNKFCLVPRQWLLSQQQSLDSCASMAFSGGIEPLPMMAGGGRNPAAVEYATCAEFCAVNSPPPPQMVARLPPPPPPSLPPFRHSQPTTMAPTQFPPPLSRQSQMQQNGATFSPNTSGNSSNSFGRHDDSGLDSV